VLHNAEAREMSLNDWQSLQDRLTWGQKVWQFFVYVDGKEVSRDVVSQKGRSLLTKEICQPQM